MLCRSVKWYHKPFTHHLYAIKTRFLERDRLEIKSIRLENGDFLAEKGQ